MGTTGARVGDGNGEVDRKMSRVGGWMRAQEGGLSNYAFLFRMLPLGPHPGEGVDRRSDAAASSSSIAGDDHNCASSTGDEAPRRCVKKKRNLYVYTLIVFSRGFGLGAWSGTSLAAFLQHVCAGRDYGLGIASGALGMSQLLFAFPLGYIGDKRRRRRALLLRIAAAVQVGAVGVLLAAVSLKDPDHAGSGVGGGAMPHRREQLWLLVLALSMLGFVMASMQSVGQSVLADSIKTRRREGPYTQVAMARNLGNSLGPLVALWIFVDSGNVWSDRAIHAAVFVGVCLMLPSSIFLCMLDDDIDGPSARGGVGAATAASNPHAIDEEEEDQAAYDDTEAIGYGATSPPDGEADGCHEDYSARSHKDGDGDSLLRPLLAAVDPECMDDRARPEQMPPVPLLHARNVPLILFLSDLVSALASGMTLRFFPLWLKDKVHLSPSTALLTESVSYLSITCFSPLMLLLKAKVGRVWVIVLTRLIGVGILFSLAFLESTWSTWQLILPLYLVRMGLMNSVTALKQSMNDYAPKKIRGRWNALDSVKSVGWSGSAILGGYLVDMYGYRSTFMLTACAALIGTALKLPLLWIVEG